MIASKSRHFQHGVLATFVAVLLAISLACAAEPRPTPATPATPAPAASPTPATAPVATPRPAAATPVSVLPTPTRVLPTPTPAVTGKPVYGGTLRYATSLVINTLDPNFDTLAGSYPVFYTIYDELFKVDPDGNMLPSLTKSWDFSADGRSVTLRLQKGIKFHDGTPFNARAVKWNFDRMTDPNQNSPRRAELEPYVERVDVLDEDTVKLQLYQPFRPLLPQLGSERVGFVVSPTAVDKYGGGREGNYGRNPVGTGPFRFIEWTLQDHLLVRRNDSYWEQGKPYLDTILYQGVADPGVRIAMLRTGNTDIVYGSEISGDVLPVLERNPELKVFRLAGTSTYILNFNNSKAPYDNKALRQAIAYAVNQEDFVKSVLGGLGTPAYTFIPAGWAYNPVLKPITYDLAKAKQKLVDAGYPKGVTIPMGCRPAGLFYNMCETVQAMVKQAGIDIDIKLMQAAVYTRMDAPGWFMTYGLGAVQWFFRVDPHIVLQTLVHSNGFKNLGAYNNPEVDRLIDQAAAIYDTAKAKALYDRIQTIMVEEGPVVLLAKGSSLFPTNKRVQGFVPYPTVFEHLEFVWLEK